VAAFGDDLAGRDALTVLAMAPTPAVGRALTRARIAAALRRAGRQRNIDQRAGQILDALRNDQLGVGGQPHVSVGVRADVSVSAG
jgi:hypothetical protein